MAKEWIDVADTAVKIGLGSLITGVFTYLGVKFSHSSEQKKFILEHRTKILEQIASESEEYIAAWNGVIMKIAGITKKEEHDIEKMTFNKNQLTWIKERDKILTNSWFSRQSVKSKLRLLKAEKTIKRFNDCISLESELRNMIFFDKNYPNYNQISEYRKKALLAQKKFHEELAQTYEELAN